MRRFRMTFGLAAVVGTLAVTAAPAVAHEFIASSVGALKGVGVGEQYFHFGPFKITCLGAKSEGNITATVSPKLFVQTKFKECTFPTYPSAGNKEDVIYLRAKFLTPVDFEYHAGGAIESGSENEEEEKLLGGTIELKLQAAKCIIAWPEQIFPARAKNPEGEFPAATYSNEEVATKKLKEFPSGFRRRVLISNELKQISYELLEGQCEGFTKTEGKVAGYTGKLREERTDGSLEFH